MSVCMELVAEMHETSRFVCAACPAAGQRGGPISPHLLALPGEIAAVPVREVDASPPTTVALRGTFATSDG